MTSDDVISVRWAAPELFSGSKASFKTDVFAFAITICEIFNQGKLPYWELKNAEVMEIVKPGNRMALSTNIPKGIQRFDSAMLGSGSSQKTNIYINIKIVERNS